MYASTPADLPEPPFRFFKGLVPRLRHQILDEYVISSTHSQLQALCFVVASLVSLYLLGAANGGRDYVCLQNEYNSELSLIYHTTRGKVELEYDLHSVYTIHSALHV